MTIPLKTRRINEYESIKAYGNAVVPQVVEQIFRTMKAIEGALIVTYGQKVRITQVITVDGRSRVYLEHPIVVPGEEYTRDYVDTREIERYVGV